MKKISLIVTIFGLLFFGCDNGDGTNDDEFVVQSNEETNNDVTTLGLIGTSVSSNRPSVATAEITESAKIKITSISEGIVVITVSDDSNHSATININVSETGIIQIDSIVKYQSTNSFVGTWSASINDIVVILACEDANWIMTFNNDQNIQEKGTYLFPVNGSSAFTTTHVKDTSTGEWVSEIPQGLDPNPYGVYGISILPSYFNGIVSGDQLALDNNITFTKSGNE
jgi:hypothetical protein